MGVQQTTTQGLGHAAFVTRFSFSITTVVGGF